MTTDKRMRKRYVPPIALSRAEAAAALGISETMLDQLVREDRTFPVFRLGSGTGRDRVLFPYRELRKWAERKVEVSK